ncbi:hypothetical protein MMC08_008163, partial [Hypocenomyce scalaris]|nr:hypothetical protein [Hypocenomyce scalaris]
MSIPDADMRVSTQGSFSADTIILENGRDPASVAKETRRRRSTVSSTNSSSEDPRLRRRLVPDDLRKRTSMSCDLCKTRRVKCERTPSASSKAEPGPCRNCIKLGVMCKSSLPRKKRIYGNAENLGVRYRMLDALVEQLLPGEDTSDIRSLREIARRFQIQTPDVEHNEFLDNSIAEATEESTLTNSIASGSPSPMIVEERSATAIHQEPDNVTPPNVSQLSENTGQGPSEDDKNPFCDRVHRRAKIHSSAGAEKLYTNTQGMPSYLGPSSSFKFMIRLRETLIDGGWKNKKGRSSGKHGGDSNKGDNVTGATNERLRREFATSRVSKAIEGQSVSATEDYGDGDEPGQAATRSRGEASTLDIRIGAGQDAATTTIADNSHAINRDLSSSTTSRIHNPLKLDLASNSFSSILKYAQDALPARETADALVEAFFDQVHPSYVVFHRGTFQLHYESLFLCSSDDEDDDKAEARDYPQLRIGADWICSIFM